MEKQTKLYLGLAALGLAGFLFWKSKTASKTASKVQAPTYPAGLQEGDFVRGPQVPRTGLINEGLGATESKYGMAVFLLKQGKKLPVTNEWWEKNGGDFSKIKTVTDSVLDVIPSGETL